MAPTFAPSQVLHFPSTDPIVTVSNSTPYIWILEMHNGVDSRLTAHMIKNALLPALDAVERAWREAWRPAQQTKDKQGGKGALIITGKQGQDKFFSNGLDFENAIKDDNFFIHTLNPLYARLLIFPLPTIAAINGHCFAGGMMLTLACDYRVMIDGAKRNAWITMNEIHFGAVLPHAFAVLMRAKFPSSTLLRKIALEGHRFPPQEALADGLLDYVVPSTEVLNKAVEIADGIAPNARTGVWGLMKRDLYMNVLEAFVRDNRVINAKIEDERAKARL